LRHPPWRGKSSSGGFSSCISLWRNTTHRQIMCCSKNLDGSYVSFANWVFFNHPLTSVVSGLSNFVHPEAWSLILRGSLVLIVFSLFDILLFLQVWPSKKAMQNMLWLLTTHYLSFQSQSHQSYEFQAGKGIRKAVISHTKWT
jgi:hypothetical protein